MSLAQHEREMLVGAFLDITADTWGRWIVATGDDQIPAELHEHVIRICMGMARAEDYQFYLQALALLSDDNLTWLVDQVGSNPLRT
jgi:hypothetical protein